LLSAIGTDIAQAIPLTPVGGFGHAQSGQVTFGVLGMPLVEPIPGIVIG
jgi:hypothetical protein